MSTPYTPQRDGRCGTVQVELDDCPTCGATMLDTARPFPRWMDNTLEAQMKRAGWQPKRWAGGDKRHLCGACVSSGKGTCTCALCGTARPASEVKDQFGDPPEFLCAHCYATVPAKVWDEKVRALGEEHRYDFE